MPADSADRLGVTRTVPETEGHDGADPRAHEDPGLRPGASLGRYVLLERVGAGGMGVVYAAYDPQLDRRVAIKVLHLGPGNDASEGRVRLLREAQAMARLSHPNVVAVHDVGTLAERVFVAMEFIDGETLTRWLRSAPRTWSAIVAVMGPIARALAAVHEAGMVHRDVKPDNIMVARDGRVRLMDLGLTRARDVRGSVDVSSPSAPGAAGGSMIPTEVTRAGVLAGTPAYMSPEQHVGLASDARSDQFSFGVTLFEALYGVRPFAGETFVQLATNIIDGRMPPRLPDVDLPAWLRAVVTRTLANDPKRRYPSMDAVVAELTRDRRRRGLRGLAIAGVVGAGAFAVFADFTTDPPACAEVTAELLDVWGDGPREAVRAAIVAGATPFAADTATRAIARLDEYAQDWVEQRRESCEVTATLAAPDDTQRLRAACLDRRKQALGALVVVLAEPSETLAARAIPAVLDLADVRRCGDTAYLVANRREFSDDAQGRDLSAVRAGVIEVRALELAGRYDDAAALARRVIDTATELDQRSLRAEARVRLGAVENFRGHYAEAEAALVAAYADARWSRHEQAAVEAAVLLVHVLGSGAGRPDDALTWAAIAEAELGPTTTHEERRADLHNNIGATHLQHSDWARAKEHFDRALALGAEVYGPEHLRVARYRTNMVPLLANMGQADRAIEIGLETLGTYERALGPTHPTVALVLNNLGTSMYRAGRHALAVEYFTRAYELQKVALGPRHPDVALAANNLGVMSRLAGDDDLAYRYYQEALSIMKEAAPDDHIRLAGVEFNLGTVAAARKDFAAAEQHHRRALEIREKRLGAEHDEVATSRLELADVALAAGRVDDAAAEVAKAAATAEARDDRVLRGNVALRRGLVAIRRGDADAARRDLATVDELLGADDVAGARARIALADLLYPADRTAARTLAGRAVDGFVAAGARYVEDATAARAWLDAHPP